MHHPDAPARRHDLDALRVLAFGLLILYHCGMFYVADWDWHVKSAHTAEWLKWPMWLVNGWRMSLLFLISGLATTFLLRRASPARFARERVLRLLVPLVFGMLVVVPPQAYEQAVANHAFAGSYSAFLVRYFTFQPWPPGAFDGSHVGITWNHLWYLPYVLAYSLALAAALPLLRSRAGLAVGDAFRRLRGWRLWVLPAIPLTLATWALAARFPITHDLLHDALAHVLYGAVFLFGYWTGDDAGLWAELRARRWAWLAAAVGTFALFSVLRVITVPEPSAARALYDFTERLNTWTWLLAVLGWGRHLLDRPFRGLAYATEAVVSWYVLHQTITVVTGAELSRLALGPVAEPLLLIGITVAGCLLLHEFVVRRSRLLRPLFGLKPLPPRGVEVATVAAAA